MGLREEKFTYEIKDFEPTIRKKPGKKAPKLVLLSVIFLAVVASAAWFIKDLIVRKSITPTAAVILSLVDFENHILGEDSPINKAAGLSDWQSYVKTNPYERKTSLKVKEAGDLPLGIGEYIKGAGIKSSAIINKKEEQSTGDVTASWTIIKLPLAQYTRDKEDFYISSTELLEENFHIRSDKEGIYSTSLKDLVNNYLGIELKDGKYNDVSLKDIVKNFKPNLSCTKIRDTKTLKVGGKNVKAYGYKCKAQVKAYSEPVYMDVYLNDKYQLLQAHLYLDDEANEYSLSIKIDFTGEKHPTDKARVQISFSIKEKELVKGDLRLESSQKDDEFTNVITGGLSIPKINYTIDQTLNYNLADNTFSFDGKYSDEVDVLALTTSGSLTKPEEEDGLIFKLDKFTIKYSEKLVAVLNISMEMLKADDKEAVITKPTGKIVELFHLTDDDKESIKNQLKAKVDYYLEMFGSLMGR